MKKNFIYIIYLVLVSALLTSCLNEIRKTDFEADAISATLKVKVLMPEDKPQSAKDMIVNFKDLTSGLEYTAVTGEDGIATVKVAYGSYVATTEKKVKIAGATEIYNGTTENMRITPNDSKVIEAELKLNYSKAGQIVIKEMYYAGCWDDKTNKAYNSKDIYFTIYNNSDEVAYLDSVCVGIINPINAPTAGKVPDWVKPGTSELRDSLALGTMVWMFRGAGNTLPLKPGAEVVCCLNAINHKKTVSNSVDLSKQGYFALYAEGITTMQSPPDPGVETMELIWRTGTSKAFFLSLTSPGLVVFSLGGKSLKQYIKDNHKVNPKTPTNANNDCLFVDKNLVLDGVECLKLDSDTKRIRPEVDNGYSMTTGTGKGESVMRRVDTESTTPGGIIRYMDTNNSKNDFELRKYASLTGKN